MIEEEKPAFLQATLLDNLERLNYLIRAFDKHIDRYETSFASLNHKATWTLATATGLAAITGFTNSALRFSHISQVNGATNTQSFSDLLFAFILFALTYLVRY